MMNAKKYEEAMVSLEQLHWHLHLNGGPDMWTAELLRQFREAIDDKVIELSAEPSKPAA